jgi:hypothetical protein
MQLWLLASLILLIALLSQQCYYNILYTQSAENDVAQSSASAAAANSSPSLTTAAELDADLCTLPRVTDISVAQFHSKYYDRKPVILRFSRGSPYNYSFDSFFAQSSVLELYRAFGAQSVTLNSANTYSHERRTLLFREYICGYVLRPVQANQSAQETFYFFGEHEADSDLASFVEKSKGGDNSWRLFYNQAHLSNKTFVLQQLAELCAQTSVENSDFHPSWPEFLQYYRILPHVYLVDPADYPSANLSSFSPLQQTRFLSSRSILSTRLSFGLGSAHSGVPMHYHDETWAEVLQGKKRWFLYPPTLNFAGKAVKPPSPIVHKEISALQWVNTIYPQFSKNSPLYNESLVRSLQRLEVCTLSAGEILYFPRDWYHLTFNLELSVFISIFIAKKPKFMR